MNAREPESWDPLVGLKQYLTMLVRDEIRSKDFAEQLQYALKVYAKPTFKRPPKIFRDEKHFVPGSDLPALIRSALEDSEYLIWNQSRVSAGLRSR